MMAMDENTKDVLILLIPTVSAIAFAYIALQQNKIAKVVTAVEEKVSGVATKVQEVEKNTNSITERLAAAKLKEGHAAGKEEERAEQKEREGEQAKGALTAKREKNGAEDKLPRDQPEP